MFTLSSFTSSVDGAVVITDRLRLIGFGAAIIALSPTLSSIKLGLDDHGKNVQTSRSRTMAHVIAQRFGFVQVLKILSSSLCHRMGVLKQLNGTKMY